MENMKTLRLSGNQLKLIAVVTMLVDHIGYLLVGDGVVAPGLKAGVPLGGWWAVYCFLRMVGRVAFPIFCFLLLEGFQHTGNWKHYTLRLGIFAVISEVPFDLMGAGTGIYWGAQNVFFTLLLGLLMMKALETVEKLTGSRVEPALLLQLMVIVLFCGAAWLLRTDYDYSGIMLIALFYWFRRDRTKLCVMGFVWMSVTMRTLYFLPGFAMAFLLIYLYGGERGRWKGRYFFYLFYPVHMVILAAVYYFVFR